MIERGVLTGKEKNLRGTADAKVVARGKFREH